MGRTKGIIKLNYNLKDKSAEKSLVYLIGYHKKRFKVSTKQNVYVKTWDNTKQRCVISTSFPDRINRLSRKVNKFLDALDNGIDDYFTNKHSFDGSDTSYFGTADFGKAERV